MDNEKFQKLILQQLKSLAEGQKYLAEEQKNLVEGQKDLAEVQKNLVEGQKDLAEVQKNLVEGQKEIRQDLVRLEYRMENEVIEKIGALFDGYTLRGEQIEDLKKHFEERLNSIETDTGYLVSRVARLEKIVR